MIEIPKVIWSGGEYRTLSAKTLIFDNLAEFAKNLD